MKPLSSKVVFGNPSPETDLLRLGWQTKYICFRAIKKLPSEKGKHAVETGVCGPLNIHGPLMGVTTEQEGMSVGESGDRAKAAIHTLRPVY